MWYQNLKHEIVRIQLKNTICMDKQKENIEERKRNGIQSQKHTTHI